jgi:hypothetical protein
LDGAALQDSRNCGGLATPVDLILRAPVQFPSVNRHTIASIVLNLHDRDASDNALTIPIELSAFSEPSFLLPGENRLEFEVIRDMLIDEVRPETHIEWLWTLDLVDLSWEILRYRGLKQQILHEHRQAAIKAMLQRLDGAGIPAADFATLATQSGRSAEQWRDDPEAAAEIEARLRRHGFNETSVNAELFCQVRSVFATFDALIHAAQNRRIALLRAIHARRAFSKRLAKASKPSHR